MSAVYLPEPDDIVVFPGAYVKEYRTQPYRILRVAGSRIEYQVDGGPGLFTNTLDRLLALGMRKAEPGNDEPAREAAK